MGVALGNSYDQLVRRGVPVMNNKLHAHIIAAIILLEKFDIFQRTCQSRIFAKRAS
jgi:hypothetical protein